MKPQAGAGFLLPPGNLGGPAPVEDVLQVLGSYPRTVVPDPDEEMGRIFGQLYFDMGGGEAYRVVQQVSYDMFYSGAVGVDNPKFGGFSPPGYLFVGIGAT